MERKLTDGERKAIANALIEQARALDLRAETLMSRKRDIDPEVEDNTTDAEDRLDKAALKRTRELTRSANAHHNLAEFINRNEVTVDCTLLIGEQF